MTPEYDLLVVGTGSAGYAPAFQCRRAGWRVAVVDEQPYGGTCARRGCDPKKILTGAAEVVDRAALMAGKGVRGRFEIDWPELIDYQKSFTEPVPQHREQGFAEAGIDALHGQAQFVSPDLLRVGDQEFRSRHFVLASGAVPRPLAIPGAPHLTTSAQFLASRTLPESVVFIGGGFISFEFAMAARAAGARVTILEMGERPLLQFDPDLVNMLVEECRARGIEVRLRTAVSAVEKQQERFLVRAENEELVAGMVVHGAGRVPRVDGLGLEEANVRYGKEGILVDDYLQSVSNPAVYAAGDGASLGPMLTPVAAMHGRTVAENLLNPRSRKAEHRVIPSVVFTYPPLAKIGLLEEEADREGLSFTTRFEDGSSWYSARRLGLGRAGYKLLVEKGTNRLLGGHLLADRAEEVVNVLSLAMRAGISTAELKETLWTYPSVMSDLDYLIS